MEDASQKIIDSEVFFDRPVLGKILVLPRSSVEQFQYNKPWACISIRGNWEPFPPNLHEANLVAMLPLQFDDVEFDRPASRLRPINDDQVDQVWKFVKEHWENVDLLVIHCAAGISRSTATAMAISDRYQPEFAKYYEQLYSPNSLVFESLHKKKWDY